MALPLLAPALITGGSALAGSVLQYFGNKKSAKDQMRFQESMSSTAYQRAMADMKSAGLNPMLAYQQGGATSPAGAGYSTPDVGSAVGAGVSTALESRRLAADLKKIDQDIATSKSVQNYNNALAIQTAFSAKGIEMGLSRKGLESGAWRSVTDMLKGMGSYVDKLIEEITTVPDSRSRPEKEEGAAFSQKDRKWKVIK